MLGVFHISCQLLKVGNSLIIHSGITVQTTISVLIDRRLHRSVHRCGCNNGTSGINYWIGNSRLQFLIRISTNGN